MEERIEALIEAMDKFYGKGTKIEPILIASGLLLRL